MMLQIKMNISGITYRARNIKVHLELGRHSQGYSGNKKKYTWSIFFAKAS